MRATEYALPSQPILLHPLDGHVFLNGSMVREDHFFWTVPFLDMHPSARLSELEADAAAARAKQREQELQERTRKAGKQSRLSFGNPSSTPKRSGAAASASDPSPSASAPRTQPRPAQPREADDGDAAMRELWG